MGPIPGKHTQDVAEPCFQTDAIECQGLNVLKSGDISYPRVSWPSSKIGFSMLRSEVSSTPKYLKHSTCSNT